MTKDTPKIYVASLTFFFCVHNAYTVLHSFLLEVFGGCRSVVFIIWDETAGSRSPRFTYLIPRRRGTEGRMASGVVEDPWLRMRRTGGAVDIYSGGSNVIGGMITERHIRGGRVDATRWTLHWDWLG